jgi:hypothetical protein
MTDARVFIVKVRRPRDGRPFCAHVRAVDELDGRDFLTAQELAHFLATDQPVSPKVPCAPGNGRGQ